MRQPDNLLLLGHQENSASSEFRVGGRADASGGGDAKIHEAESSSDCVFLQSGVANT